MVSIEIMLTIVFTILSSVMYVMWRYFDDLIKCFQCDVVRLIEQAAEMSCVEDCKKRTDFLEQKCKDSIQSNAICCRSAIDRVNSRISMLENKRTKKDEGSIAVVVPTFKEKSLGK